jgi:hypothetical protein
MPNKYEVILKSNNQLLLQCCVNSNQQNDQCSNCRRCHADTRAGTRCKLHACKDTKYCHVHLRSKYGLVVANSNIKKAGKGLFCKQRNRRRGDKRKPEEKAVFKKGDIIVPYDGERMTMKELSERYDIFDEKGNMIENTAPYAVPTGQDTDIVVDGACRRGIANYINDSHGTRKRANVKLREGNIVAIRNIYKGDELFYSYGKDYWKDIDQITQKEYYVKGNRRISNR